MANGNKHRAYTRIIMAAQVPPNERGGLMYNFVIDLFSLDVYLQ